MLHPVLLKTGHPSGRAPYAFQSGKAREALKIAQQESGLVLPGASPLDYSKHNRGTASWDIGALQY